MIGMVLEIPVIGIPGILYRYYVRIPTLILVIKEKNPYTSISKKVDFEKRKNSLSQRLIYNNLKLFEMNFSYVKHTFESPIFALQ